MCNMVMCIVYSVPGICAAAAVTLLFYLLLSNLLFGNRTDVRCHFMKCTTLPAVCSTIVDFRRNMFQIKITCMHCHRHRHRNFIQFKVISLSLSLSLEYHNLCVQFSSQTLHIVTSIYPLMWNDSLAFLTYQTQKNTCQIPFLILGFAFFSIYYAYAFSIQQSYAIHFCFDSS